MSTEKMVTDVLKRTEGERGKYILSFFCPGCKTIHQVNETWHFNNNLQAPTIKPSILVRWSGLESGKEIRYICHSYITDGKIQFLHDCFHELKGQTVPIPGISNLKPFFSGL